MLACTLTLVLCVSLLLAWPCQLPLAWAHSLEKRHSLRNDPPLSAINLFQGGRRQRHTYGASTTVLPTVKHSQGAVKSGQNALSSSHFTPVLKCTTTIPAHNRRHVDQLHSVILYCRRTTLPSHSIFNSQGNRAVLILPSLFPSSSVLSLSPFHALSLVLALALSILRPRHRSRVSTDWSARTHSFYTVLTLGTLSVTGSSSPCL